METRMKQGGDDGDEDGGGDRRLRGSDGAVALCLFINLTMRKKSCEGCVFWEKGKESVNSFFSAD